MRPRPLLTRLLVLPLEDRVVPAGLDIRSYDGTSNNLTNLSWGSAGSDFLRLAPVSYTDGIWTPTTALPSARAISNALSDQAGQDILSSQALSGMAYAWGQFVDHDLDLTKSASSESLNIAVPKGDPTFDPNGTGTVTIPMSRSGYDPATGTSKTNPRQQVNTITSFLDGSMIYGSDEATAKSLRTMSGGKLKTSAGNLPPTDAAGFYLAGDSRANENPELTSLQVVFLREHNRKAAEIAKANPGLSDEAIYQKARAWVIAEVQAITYNEWLPAILGPGAIKPYTGYSASTNPGISNEFATAAFRFGHSMLVDDIEFLDNNGNETRDGVSLAEAFFNPSLVAQNGIEPLLKYLASDPASEIDTKVVDSVRNLLLTVPGGSMTLDLASLNIQRGRDHGLADYNTTRAAFGLPKVKSFADITKDTTVQAKLKSLYGSVDKIDLWVGVLAEDHVQGGSVGPTARAIIVDQFSRLRAGDRFWYEKTFSGAELQQLHNTHLTDVIQRNTTLTTLQPNAFVFKPEVTGMVFTDANKDAKRNPNEKPATPHQVELINADGEVISVKSTDAQGRFRFDIYDGLRTGEYTVKVILGGGETLTTPSGSVIKITTGDVVTKMDIGIVGPGTPPKPIPQPPRPMPMPNGPHMAMDFHGVDLNTRNNPFRV